MMNNWYKQAKKGKNSKGGKEWNPNPWAVCTKSVGRDDPKKYERCVMDVKEKQASSKTES